MSTKPADQGRRAWRSGGEAALACKGPGGSTGKLDEGRLARLSAASGAGPAACGRGQDQRRALARVAAHRAAERDEDAIAAWRNQARARARG